MPTTNKHKIGSDNQKACQERCKLMTWPLPTKDTYRSIDAHRGGPSSRQSSTRSSSSALGTPFRWTEVITCSTPPVMVPASTLLRQWGARDRALTTSVRAMYRYQQTVIVSYTYSIWRITNKINHHKSNINFLNWQIMHAIDSSKTGDLCGM